MTKDQKVMFKALATFLRANVSLVADKRDSNEPWELLDKLNRFGRCHASTTFIT